MPPLSGRPTGPPPTLADVAEVAGVSRQTVSNAVNNPELLRADTLARVKDAIDRLGYTPNRAARSLRTRASHLIGLRLPPLQEGTANAIGERFVHALVETAGDAGYHVMLFHGDDTDPIDGYDDLLRSTAVDAFVVTDTFLGNPQAAWLQARRARFVAFGRPWNSPGAHHPWVDVDGAHGAELATTHLIDRGHTRIAWLGWSEDSLLGEERRSAWQRTMEAHGLDAGTALRCEESIAAGREAAESLLAKAPPSDGGPTAIACASDTLALGVLHALQDQGLRPGGDIAVTGFDDSRVAQTVPPGLTSVRQPVEDAAAELVGALEELLATPSSVVPGVLLKPTLVVRGTS